MYVLGLATLPDAAAALMCDGEPVAAAEEERFSRVKHQHGLPHRAVDYCLQEAGIELAEVGHVGLFWKPWVIRKKMGQTLKSLAVSPDAFRARLTTGVGNAGEGYLGMLDYPRRLRARYGRTSFRFHFLDHHLCHAASAFFVSPFERAAVLTLDGSGEDTTTLLASGEGTRIDELKRIRLPHSLGQFYSAITNFLGFDMFAGDEWKVMGLAAYGEPEYYDFFAQRVLRLNGDNGFLLDLHVLDHHLAKRYKFHHEFVAALGPPRTPGEEISERHKNVAASAQRVIEDVVLQLLRSLHRETRAASLCLAGGVAFNSVMNGRIIKESPFERVFVQPAAGDAGCSLGAASLIHHGLLGRPRGFVMDHAYYGPSFNSGECAEALRAAGVEYDTLPDEQMLPRVGRIIADGGIVGWFQGRMEFGPRALGNRSFLADPRRSDMRELLNKKVKLREWFRPLAPSMHEEASADFFGTAHRDPFMVTVLQVAEGARAKIPAVVHVDDTARAQTVSRAVNPRYWQLIEEFRKITGVPVLLNTSFNVQEPIVCRPEEAIRTFDNADFDALVLEDHLVSKRRPTAN